MPNVITHNLMAEEVSRLVKTPRIKTAIQKYKKVFLLGSSGPDIFFYYNQYPWTNQALAKETHAIGNRVHTENINAFYQRGIELIRREKRSSVVDIQLAYLAGHLMHWALDVCAHPYIFNQSGDLDGPAPACYWHFRMESMIDTLMLQEIKDIPLTMYHPAMFFKLNDLERQVVSQWYASILNDVFNENITRQRIEGCITTGYEILGLLHDPSGRKFKTLRIAEKAMGKTWAFTSHVVLGQADHKHDILNLNHREWSHPADPTRRSTASFVDLYEQSILLGQEALDTLGQVLEDESLSMDSVLQNRSYDSGDDLRSPFINYDSVYERGNAYGK